MRAAALFLGTVAVVSGCARNPYADVGNMQCSVYLAAGVATDKESPYHQLVLNWLAIEFAAAKDDTGEAAISAFPEGALQSLAGNCEGHLGDTLAQRFPSLSHPQ